MTYIKKTLMVSKAQMNKVESSFDASAFGGLTQDDHTFCGAPGGLSHLDNGSSFSNTTNNLISRRVSDRSAHQEYNHTTDPHTIPVLRSPCRIRMKVFYPSQLFRSL